MDGRVVLIAVVGGLAGCSGGTAPAAAPATAPAGGAAVADVDGEAARVRAAFDLPEPARCEGCHPSEVRAYRTSGHAVALRPIAEATLPFAPGAHVADAWPHRLEHVASPAGPALRFVDADGELATYPITHVLGGVEREMYVAPMGADARPQMLPAEFGLAHGTFRQFWRPGDLNALPPGDPAFWRTVDRAFVNDCLRCHSPRTKSRYDPDAGAYHVDWGTRRDVGLSCAACHGDTDAHVRSATAGGPRARTTEKPLPTPGAKAELYSCARCHGLTTRLGPHPRADDVFYDALNPVLLDESLYYHWNGRNADESGHTLLSWELAACFHKGGLRCTDCHAPHGGGSATERRDRARASCTECHPGGKLPRTCREHPAAAVDCLACHMPRFEVAEGHAHVTDHRLAVPDPELTRRLGIPNACGACHAQGPEWAEAALAKWEARERPERARSLALAAAGQRSPDAWPALRPMLRDPTVPWPVAATAARLLAGDPSAETGAALIVALEGAEHPMVRAGAAFGLGPRDDGDSRLALRAALKDPRRVVRVMAAVSLLLGNDFESVAETTAEIAAVCRDVPDHFDMRRWLGYARILAGDNAGAITELRRAARLNPHDTRMRKLLDEAIRRLKEGG